LGGLLVGNRAEDEPAIVIAVIVIIERAAAFQRQIGSIDEVLMEAEFPRVHVIDPGTVLSVHDEHQVGEGIESAPVVDSSQQLELGPGMNPIEPEWLAVLIALGSLGG